MADTKPPVPQYATRVTAPHLIMAVTAVFAAAAIFAYVLHVRFLAAPELGLHIPMALLAALFFGAEVALIRLHFHHGSYTFVMTEIPLVIGLFTVTPGELLISQLIAVSAAATFVNRWPPLKATFNLAENAFATVLALTTFHAVLPTTASAGAGIQMSGQAWLAAAAAIATFMVVNCSAVTIAIGLTDRSVRWSRTGVSYLMAATATATNLCLGLVTMSVIDADVRAAWLLAVPAGIVFLAYRAYVRERTKHESLEFLYESSRVFAESGAFDQALVGLLGQTRAMFRSDVAEALITSPSGTILRTRVGGTGAQPVMQALSPDEAARLLSAVSPRGSATVFDTHRSEKHRQAVATTTFLTDAGLRNAMVAPLHDEKRGMGMLLVGNRSSDIGEFRKADVRLLEALARQISVALANGQLEHSLAQLRAMEQQLTQLAFHDPLTGLANRALFYDQVEGVLRQPGELRRSCAVLFIDLDDFKTVNDTLGHDIGDKLLVAVAHRITACLRPSDTPARLGGDEFAVLVQDEQAVQAAERIAARITDALRQPVCVDGQELHVRASIGIATTTDGGNADETLRNADLAMYTAKSDGKGRYRWFKPSMRADVVRRHQLRSDLAHATDRAEFQVHYQPIVDLRTGRPVAAEALLRWEHPQRGLVFPGTFIPDAESSGVINEIGRFVLQNACADLAAWNHACAPMPPFAVSVNLSPVQVAQPDLVTDVEDALADAGLEPTSLIFEITEGMMLRGSGRVYRTLNQLRDLGVRLAMDDFGTGYASLASLRELPIDIIKIAKTFTDDISGNEEKSPFVRAMIELGEALGVTTLAEGIETNQQARELERLGCQLGQGYQFARPIAAAGIEVLLQRTFARRNFDATVHDVATADLAVAGRP